VFPAFALTPTPDGRECAVSDNLRNMALRAGSDPAFLAFALAAYQRRFSLDDEMLAAQLGMRSHILVHLRLCRTPESLAEIRDIAARMPIDPFTLALICNFKGD
jgi:hypothetical protein